MQKATDQDTQYSAVAFFLEKYKPNEFNCFCKTAWHKLTAVTVIHCW